MAKWMIIRILRSDPKLILVIQSAMEGRRKRVFKKAILRGKPCLFMLVIGDFIVACSFLLLPVGEGDDMAIFCFQ